MLKHGRLKIPASGGFTIIEVVVVAGLFSAFILLLSGVTQFLNSNSGTLSINNTRTSLMLEMRKNAGDLTVLRNLLHQPENSALLQCVCGSGCTGAKSTPFSLYEPGDKGPQPSLKHYDVSGFACSPASPNCVIEVETDFFAQCMPTLPSADPLPAQVCPAPAEFVGVVITVRQNPAYTGTQFNLKPIQSVAYTEVADLTSTTPAVCP